MKRNFFKKLAFVMALALVVTGLAPAAASEAAANPKLNENAKTIYVGKKFNFNVKNAKGEKQAWTSSNKKVATVKAKNGVTTAVTPGTATISCKVKGVTLKATVTVKQDATAVAIMNPVDNVSVGDATYQFKRTITPKASTNKTFYVIDSASNTAGAVAVNDKGIINVTQTGEFKIKAVTARSRAQFETGNWRAESAWLTVKVSAPEVTAVEAFSSKSVKVTFSDAISSEVSKSNFSINGQVIESATLAADGKSVLLSLTSSMSNGAEYTLTTTNIPAAKGSGTSSDTKTFTYTKAAAASISFASNRVAIGQTVAVIVKDANGNDISADFSILDYDVVSTDMTVIARTLVSSHVGTSTVNVTIRGTEISTGDLSITVVENLATALEIAYTSFSPKEDKWGMSFPADSSNHRQLYTIIKDQNGIVIDDSTDLYSRTTDLRNYDVLYTFESSNYTVATVDSYNRTVTGISPGKATITMTAEYHGVKASKQFEVTVTAPGELPYPKRIEIISNASDGTGTSTHNTAVSTIVNSANYVGDDGTLVDRIGIIVIDQFGNHMPDEYVNIKLTTGSGSPLTIAQFENNNADVDFNLQSNNKWTPWTWYSVEAAGNSVTGSVTISVTSMTDGSIKATGTIRVVNQGNPSGHNVYFGDTTLDKGIDRVYTNIFEAPAIKDANYKGGRESNVTAFKKDSNGNQYKKLTYAGTTEGSIGSANQFAIIVAASANPIVKVTSGGAIITGDDCTTGKVNVNVLVGEATGTTPFFKTTLAKTQVFTVVDSIPVPTNVKQVATSIAVSVGESIGEKLKEAFVVSDQYDRVLGNKATSVLYKNNLYTGFYDFDFDARFHSDNSSIVRVDTTDYSYAYAHSAGTVGVSVVLAGKTYRITVVVNK